MKPSDPVSKPLNERINLFGPLLVQVVLGIHCIQSSVGVGFDHRGYPLLDNETLGVAGYFFLTAAGIVSVVSCALPPSLRRLGPLLAGLSLTATSITALALGEIAAGTVGLLCGIICLLGAVWRRRTTGQGL